MGLRTNRLLRLRLRKRYANLFDRHSLAKLLMADLSLNLDNIHVLEE